MKPTSVEKVEEKAEVVPETTDIQSEPAAQPKLIFKPTMKPKAIEEKTEEAAKVSDIQSEPTLPKENTGLDEVKPRPKPVFKPMMRPKKEE
jgi:hypothetical protein